MYGHGLVQLKALAESRDNMCFTRICFLGLPRPRLGVEVGGEMTTGSDRMFVSGAMMASYTRSSL